MIPRSLVLLLVYAFPVLIVAFAVVAGGHVLLAALGDAAAANVIVWVAAVLGALIVLNLLLLVGVLGINAVSENDGPAEHASPRDRQPGDRESN